MLIFFLVYRIRLGFSVDPDPALYSVRIQKPNQCAPGPGSKFCLRTSKNYVVSCSFSSFCHFYNIFREDQDQRRNIYVFVDFIATGSGPECKMLSWIRIQSTGCASSMFTYIPVHSLYHMYKQDFHSIP